MSELPWLRSLVKHNVAAKNGSSKPLTSNELWLLELRIKSTRILASIPDVLWDVCKSSIKAKEAERNFDRSCDNMPPPEYVLFSVGLYWNLSKTRYSPEINH